MLICSCHAVDDTNIRQAIVAGADDEQAVGEQTAAGTECGGCRDHIRKLLANAGVSGAGSPGGSRADPQRTAQPRGGAMQGNPDVVALLNEQLTAELTAINQYFLHAKMQQHWGYPLLADHTREESVDEMRHAERLTDRILFLDGVPNYQRIGSLRIGQTIPEQLQADLAIEREAVDRLRTGITLCRTSGDSTSALLLEAILADEEAHIDYLDTQLSLLETLGEQHYLAQHLISLSRQ